MPRTVFPLDWGAVGVDVCAAGWNCSGVCPVKEVKAKAVTPDATSTALITHASTSGRHPRRRGRFLTPGGG